jgi:cell division protein FtsI/penicillin-binding protein 2
VVGSVGTPSKDQAAELTREGFPPGTLTGTSGLELAFNSRLSGKPGGQLVAVRAGEENQVGGGRVLAQTDPVRGKAVRTNIDPELQQTAVEALGSLYGGAAVLNAQTGAVMALSGIAFSAPQPPGSTFKIITATGALDAGIVKTTDTFPVESSNSEIGREIANAHDELCGGTFVESFAQSCNTVFAPLGAELGADKLVDTAQKFGFNSRPELFDPQATDLIRPPASTIPDDLAEGVATGESAIGQGQVLATPLEMASVAQTIANDGVRLPTPMARGDDLAPEGEPVKVTSPETAATMRQMMIEVVNSGTGVAAALPGIQVAGKTGTAELGPKALDPGQELEPGEDPELETDAWFTAFAPATKPKIVVAAMVVNSDGDGGTIAAPIVRQIMAAYFDVS